MICGLNDQLKCSNAISLAGVAVASRRRLAQLPSNRDGRQRVLRRAVSAGVVHQRRVGAVRERRRAGRRRRARRAGAVHLSHELRTRANAESGELVGGRAHDDRVLECAARVVRVHRVRTHREAAQQVKLAREVSAREHVVGRVAREHRNRERDEHREGLHGKALYPLELAFLHVLLIPLLHILVLYIPKRAILNGPNSEH